MKKFLALILMLGTAVAFAPKAGAAECPNCQLLKGDYNFNITGNAVVDTTPTTGTCSQSGSVAAAFTNGELRFDGHGNISRVGQSGVLSIGATTCTNFGIVGGSYEVEDRGDGNFEAIGVMNVASQNAYSPCLKNSTGQLALGSQPFVITGHIGGKKLDITTYGVDSTGAATYAEGPFGHATNCTAPIENFITSGTVEKY